jgi:hypothetical protein
MAALSNHDCKITINGEDTKHILWYISSYATKRQQNSSNVSALLAKTFACHRDNERQSVDLHQVNKRLIQRCENAPSHEQEFSAPEVVPYLTGWNDQYVSHHLSNYSLEFSRQSAETLFSYPSGTSVSKSHTLVGSQQN